MNIQKAIVLLLSVSVVEKSEVLCEPAGGYRRFVHGAGVGWELIGIKEPDGILSVPEYGWTDFQQGSEETRYSLSYLADVALVWLGLAIHGLETLDTFSVHGFCEPGRMVCTVSYWNCYILRHLPFRKRKPAFCPV